MLLLSAKLNYKLPTVVSVISGTLNMTNFHVYHFFTQSVAFKAAWFCGVYD